MTNETLLCEVLHEYLESDRTLEDEVTLKTKVEALVANIYQDIQVAENEQELVNTIVRASIDTCCTPGGASKAIHISIEGDERLCESMIDLVNKSRHTLSSMFTQIFVANKSPQEAMDAGYFRMVSFILCFDHK